MALPTNQNPPAQEQTPTNNAIPAQPAAPQESPSERTLRLEIERLRAEKEAVDRQLAARMTPDELKEKEIAELRLFYQNHQVELRKAQLLAYLERRMRERGVTTNNTGPFMEMIGGASEEEIEASIDFALTEYKRFYDAAYQQALTDLQQGQRQSNSSRVTAVSVQAVPSPQQFPRPVQPQAVVQLESGSQQYQENVAAITSQDAVRTGVYQQHRRQLMENLRTQQHVPNGQWNAPRPFVSTTQQPHGLPTPPQQVQQQNFAPQQPQNLPPTPVHQQQPGGIQPQNMGQRIGPGSQVVQAIPDQLSMNGVIDLAQVRENAMAAAARARAASGGHPTGGVSVSALNLNQNGQVMNGMNRNTT